jgi:peptidyl-prolyl cis-trans isomerase D
MLEQLRRSSQSLLIYVLFGIVIAVFIINFGPQSQGGCESSVSRASYAAKVGSGEVSSRDFRYAYILAGGPQYQPQRARELRLRERVLDELVERELLVAEAERLGFAVSDEEVEDLVAESKMLGVGGYEQSAAASMQKNGHFDYETFTRFTQFQLNLSPKAFIEQQKRELLASRVRNLLRGGVNVSEHEVKEEFERQGNQVNLEYVRFSWRRHEDGIELTPAEVQTYAKANEKKLKELYDQRKFLYENAPKERRLRQILVKLDSGASPDATAAAEKKAQGLLERIKKGETFAAVAKAASDDPRSKLRGGDVGWRRQGATPFGAALDEKVFAGKDGEVVGPMKGNDGFYLVLPEATREGNITFEQVQNDLAETELRQERAKAKAKAEAEAALAKAKAPAVKDKTLKDLFPAPTDSGQGTDSTPRAEETGLFARRGTVVEGLGTAPELAKAAFELQTASPLAGPYEVAGSYVIVRLKERKQADLAEFDKKKGELMHDAALMRGEEILAEWTQRRCQEAKEAKRIRVNLDILRYDDMPAEQRVAYEPCTPPFRF